MIKKESSWRKSLVKNIPADVKPEVKQQETKELIAVNCNFL